MVGRARLALASRLHYFGRGRRITGEFGDALIAATGKFFGNGLTVMRLVPLAAKVIVKRLEPELKTAGGIVLPDSAHQRPQQGRVLSVGDSRRLKSGAQASHQVREGDRVVFNSYAGVEVKVDGQTLLIMNEDEILAVVE